MITLNMRINDSHYLITALAKIDDAKKRQSVANTAANIAITNKHVLITALAKIDDAKKRQSVAKAVRQIKSKYLSSSYKIYCIITALGKIHDPETFIKTAISLFKNNMHQICKIIATLAKIDDAKKRQSVAKAANQIISYRMCETPCIKPIITALAKVQDPETFIQTANNLHINMLSKSIRENLWYDEISDFITALAEIAGMKKRTIVANTVVKLVNKYKLKKNFIFELYTLKIIIAYLKIFADNDDDMFNGQACRKALRETLEALPVTPNIVKICGWNRILKKLS